MRLLFVLLVVAHCTALNSAAQNTEEALHHLELVTASLEKFRAETWNVLRLTAQNRSSSELDFKINAVADKIEATRRTLVDADGYYNDLSAKVAVTVFLKTAHRILTDDYQQIKRLEQSSQQSFVNMEKYLNVQNKANERLSEAGERLDDELKRFAERYDIEVTEKKSPLSAKIEMASQGMAYYNQVYLSFFKVHDQKLKLYTALSAQDLDAIEEELALLESYCAESIGRLQILGSFMDDSSLNVAATDIINQMKSEAQETFPAALRAIEKRQIFLMAQGVFDAIPEKERTQEDIDHLNSVIDPLNKAIENQNEKFTLAEEKRETLFTNWNQQIAKFFSTYLN